MKQTVKYFVEGSEVNYSDCLEYFSLYSGFTSQDAKTVFDENNNPDSCGYISQECSEVEVIYEFVEA